MRSVLSLLACCWMTLAGAAIAAQPSVYLEDLTSTEVRDAIRAGKTTVIIPVGGTEQNGPHMVLGKHNIRARVLAGRIAESLGNTLVAPVLSYVPEGSIAPPGGHMRFAGTISVPDDAFKSVLDAAARSFKQHAFVDVVLLGDSGNYQHLLKAVAARLNRDWAGSAARAHFIEDYYRAGQAGYVQALKAKGLSDAQIGTHAGTADTSLLMAVDAAGIRPERLSDAARDGLAGGVAGDPRPSSAALGQLGVDLIVTRTVASIRAAQASKR